MRKVKSALPEAIFSIAPEIDFIVPKISEVNRTISRIPSVRIMKLTIAMLMIRFFSMERISSTLKSQPIKPTTFPREFLIPPYEEIV